MPKAGASGVRPQEGEKLVPPYAANVTGRACNAHHAGAEDPDASPSGCDAECRGEPMGRRDESQGGDDVSRNAK